MAATSQQGHLRVLVATFFALELHFSNAKASSTNTALVSRRFIGNLSARVNTSWRLVDIEEATDADVAEASTVVPDFHPAFDLGALLRKMPDGRLLQIGMTEPDWLNMSIVPPSFTVCVVHQAGVSIPEYVIAAVLSWNIRLPQEDAAFRKCTWHQHEKNTCAFPSDHREAKGQTLGIVGYGTIGVGVAERAAALGMRIVAVTHPVPAVTPSPLAWIGGDDMLPRLMEESDFVVVAAPLTKSTKGMINAEALSKMKASGVLINIARGPIVEEAALFDALQKGSIGGAVLDVWWNSFGYYTPGSTEWPSAFNYSALPNVWITGHMSAATMEARTESVNQMAFNLDALVRGEALLNVIRNSTRAHLPQPYLV